MGVPKEHWACSLGDLQLWQNERVKLALPIGETEIVQVRGVRRLLAVSVQLVVDGDAVPTGGNVERWVGFVQDCGYAIQRY